MELHGPQEALKVEIQCHQKLAVRGCPVGNTKPLSLIKPPSQSIAISVVPAKAPISMVTARVNGQKAASPEPPQTGPVNLQAMGHSSLGKRATELPHSQVLGGVTAVPIKVPQISSLHRLAGHAPTVLPQVRPKTVIPDSLPHSPCQEQQSSPPASLQKASVVSPTSRGPTLPTANGTFSHEAPPQPPLSGVAYAIISASSNTAASATSDAVKVQPLLFSTDNKVIIIQPQAPSVSQSSSGPRADNTSRELVRTPPAKKEDPEKTAFMVALGLVTTDYLEEIQNKRQERKRRSTANPAYSGLFEPERKRHFLNNPLLSARDSEEHCWKENLEHEEHCAVCKEGGDLQPCRSCSRSYHPDCLHPPLKTPLRGAWMCPKCQKKVFNKNMSWPQNFLHSYVTYKTAREQEKRRLLRKNDELKKEHDRLEEREQELSYSLTECMDLKSSLLEEQRNTQSSLERLKTLIRLIQRDQMLQATMTAASTSTETLLLPLAWTKPGPEPSSSQSSSLLLQKSQGQN